MTIENPHEPQNRSCPNGHGTMHKKFRGDDWMYSCDRCGFCRYVTAVEEVVCRVQDALGFYAERV